MPISREPRRHALADAVLLVLVVLVLGAANSVAAETRSATDGPEAALARMQSAVDALDYEGTFVYVHEGRLDAMRILHRADSGGAGEARERLIALNGAQREVVREGDRVVWLLPEEETVMVDRSPAGNPLREALPGYDDGVEAHYEFTDLGRARIAGRLTSGMLVRPRDDLRYGYRLWLDTETGMPLKSELVDPDGEVVEQVMFTSVRIGVPISDDALEPETETEGYRTVEIDPRGEGAPLAGTLWQVERLPPGFRLSARNLERTDSGGTREQLVFSDGLASVSVFVEKARGQEPPAGKTRMGATHARSERLGAYQVTVIGEVPADTVELIADSVTLMSGGGR